MTLLQPLFLLLAVLSGIALLIAYYLQRSQAPRLPFSAMRFLPSSSSSRVIRSALPPPALLLPILVLAVITFSLSRPTVSQTQPKPLALIIDDTAFVAIKDNKLRPIALSVAEKLSPKTGWGVFTTSGVTVASGTGRDSLVTLLKSYSTSDTPPSYSPAIFNQAINFIKESTGAAPTLLLLGSNDTFMEYTGLDSLRRGLEKDGIRLISLSSAVSSRPVFIAAVDLPNVATLDSEARARLGIANTTKESASGELRLLYKGSTLVTKHVKLAAQSLSWQDLKVTPRSSGINKYEIVLSAAAPGAAEEKALWDLTALANQNVLILASTSGSAPAYVEKALKASPLIHTITIIEPEALDVSKLKDLLSKARIVVMDGVDSARFNNELGAELTSWVEKGGTLVFTSGPRVNDRWNRNNLSSILPAPFKIKNDKLLQGVAVRDHAVVRNLEMESVPLTVNQFMGLQTPPSQQVLISVGGEPLLLFRNVKLGTVFLWTSTADPRWNNWAQHPSFPVFWSNVMVYAVSGNAPAVSPHPDITPTLWRSASNTSSEQIYYVAYSEGSATLPPPLQDALIQPVTAYRDYHVPVLVFGLALGAGYLGWMIHSWRRARR